MNKLTWLLILLPSLLFSQNSSRTFGVIVMSEKNKIESFINSIAAGRNRDVRYKQLGHLTSTYLITSSNDADIYKACQNDKDVIAFGTIMNSNPVTSQMTLKSMISII
ncbi:MAG: hypothetical protein IPP49_05160 [Saprospiraceae bacterium]|nr:hypothetical protein [Saprospiraceae bacterium]